MSRFRLPFITLVALGLSASSASACRLALALGFDVSRSVDGADYRNQTDGIIAAFANPVVRDLLLRPEQPVAVAVYEWAGQYRQTLLADWVLLDSAETIDALAQRIETHHRVDNSLTAVGSALVYGRALLSRAPQDCPWHTLDLAGDGQNNDGYAPARIYAEGGFDGIVVNGLVIGEHDPEVRAWYERHVLHGPGAFAEYAVTHAEFADAFLRKLIRELTEPMLGMTEAPATQG